MREELVIKFKQYFTELSLSNVNMLNEIYATSIVFKDPIHELKGLDRLKKYFEKLNRNLVQGSFEFTDENILKNKAFLSWEMKLHLKKPNKFVTASGITVLSFEEKITMQRDYFDAGELFYENVPLLGGIIKSIKRKISNP